MSEDAPILDEAGEGPTEQATRASEELSSWRPFLSPERLGETGSTNADLIERAAAGAPEGTVLLADSQSAGRGRLDRKWVDHPGGSLLCSLLFRPGCPMNRWFLAGWSVALAAAAAARQVAGVECSFKWPNDLLAGDDDLKVAGVLSEIGGDDALVVGIGMNVNWPTGSELVPGATSLDRLAGTEVDRDRLAESFLWEVDRRWREANEDPRALRTDYRAICSTIGRLVRIEMEDGVVTGRGLDVDDDGRLLVDVGACIRTVDAGDVVHLRGGPGGGGAVPGS